MNAGQLIEILSQFPRETPVLKTNDDGGGYDDIPFEGIREYDVVNGFAEFDWQAKFVDCDSDQSGCFKAIVL
jgi:hypothetical protein